LEDEDDALWSYMHRRTGMLRVDFARLRALGQWLYPNPGEMIADTESSRANLFIMVQGVAQASYTYEGYEGAGRKTMRSGDCFDYRIFNSLGVFVGFPNQQFEAVAGEESLHPVIVYRIPLAPLVGLFEAAPSMATFLRTYSTGVLAREVQLIEAQSWSRLSFDSYGAPEEEAWTVGGRSRDFCSLGEVERQRLRPSWDAFSTWFLGSLSPFVRLGERHNQGALSGDIASSKVRQGDLIGLVDMQLHGRLAATRPPEAAAAAAGCPGACLPGRHHATPTLAPADHGSVAVEMGVVPSLPPPRS